MELQNLKAQLVSLESERERISQQGLDTSFQDATIREVKAHIADLESQKTIEQRVEEEVQSNGYALDTMEVDGLTAPEIITDDSQYKLIRKGVQVLIVGMNLSHSALINALKLEHSQEAENLRDCLSAEASRADQMKDDNTDLEVANYQLGLENDELKEKVRKGAEQNNELLQQLEQKNQHIADLQNQIAIGVRGALNVVDIPQDTSKFAADIIAKKVRITNDRFKDENGIDRRIKTAVNVLTGEKIEYEAIYEKRFIILDATQAEQYRTDEANRKAELEAQNTVIPVMEPQPEHVEELVEDAEPGPIEEVQATDDQGNTSVEGNKPLDESLGQDEQESEVITLESLKSEVDKIKTYLGLVA